MVDEAHGAHLGFGLFPTGAVAAGADLVVHSLHKTLPSLTQTGLLHVSGPRVDPLEVERQLAVFETSSPSYPLMASIDRCVQLMEGPGQEWMEAYAKRLERFDRQIAPLQYLRVLGHEDRPAHSSMFALDPGKLFICCQGVSWQGAPLTGVRLAGMLRTQYRLEPEMAGVAGVLAMTSLCDTDETLERLALALIEIDSSCTSWPEGAAPGAGVRELSLLLPPSEQVHPMEEALLAPQTHLPLEQCEGHIAAEYVWAYPPGIPLLTPGERITDDFVRFARQTIAQGGVLHSTTHGLPDTLRVCGSHAG